MYISSDAALESILRSPRLPEYANAIAEKLADEQKRREQFYNDMSDEYKVEFIGGEVVMHSPAKHSHLIVSGNLSTLLHVWFSGKGQGIIFVEKCLCVFTRNDYEPDIVFFGPEKSAMFVNDTMKFPVPDFIVEILSPSTKGRDYGVKFEDFAAHGVEEYWIIDPDAELLEQYLLDDNQTYQLALKSGSGEVTSRVLSNLSLPIKALFNATANQQALLALLNDTPT